METIGILSTLMEAIEYMPDEILIVSEVAKYLKVAEKTVYTMAQKSEIPCFKVRGQWRFRGSDLDEWIVRQTQAAVSPSQQTCISIKPNNLAGK